MDLFKFELKLCEVFDKGVEKIGKLFRRGKDEIESFLEGIGWYYEGEIWNLGVLISLMRFLLDKRDRMMDDVSKSWEWKYIDMRNV